MKSAFSSEAFSCLALKESYKLQVLRHIFLCKHGQKVSGRKKGNLLVLLKKKSIFYGEFADLAGLFSSTHEPGK